jgi:DNA polymerase
MTEMTDGLNLDVRQRAMLDEMGIKLFWWRQAAPVEAPVAQALAVQPEVAEEPIVQRAAPTPAQPVRVARPPEPAAEPQRAPLPVAQGAVVLAEAPRLVYGDAAAPRGGWLIVADMPPEPDGRHGEPFAGDAGRLLDNMLRALQLHDGKTPVHLVRTHRGVASGQPGSPRPIGEALAEHAAGLEPRLVLAMGPLAAQSLMQSADPLGKLRGRAVPLAIAPGWVAPVIATYHPAYLLRNPADKGRAWADLCLAAEQLGAAD